MSILENKNTKTTFLTPKKKVAKFFVERQKLRKQTKDQFHLHAYELNNEGIHLWDSGAGWDKGAWEDPFSSKWGYVELDETKQKEVNYPEV